MPDISDGIEIAGESDAGREALDPNTQTGFDAMLVNKVSPDRQSAAEVRSEVASPETATSVRDGLIFSDPTPKRSPESASFEANLVEGQEQIRAEQAKTKAMRDELATRRFVDVYGTPEATEHEQAAAALQLQIDSPEQYTALIQGLDEAELDSQLEFGDYDEPDDKELPGVQLDRRVEQIKADIQSYIAEPPDTHRRRHTRLGGRLLA